METVFPFCPAEPLPECVRNKEPDYLLAGGGGAALYPGAVHQRDGDFPSKCQCRVENILSRMETLQHGHQQPLLRLMRSLGCFSRSKKEEKSFFPSEHEKK